MDKILGDVDSPRRTISLDSLRGKPQNNDDNDENVQLNGNNSEPSQNGGSVIPVLYDWIQYIDGSIMGKVRGSRNFKDGSSVSTSPIKDKAVGGNVITTSSGSK